MTTKILALVLSISVIGCATNASLPAPKWKEGLHAGVDAADPKDADLVVLHKSLRYMVINPAARPGITEIQHHRVVKVLTEAGFAAASAHVFVPDKGSLTYFRARTIAADGTVYEVDPATVLSDVSTSGEEQHGTRSFQYPRVAVGSILELTTTITRPFASWFLMDSLAERHPVNHYEVEVWLDSHVVPDVFVNNASPKLDYDKKAPGGLQRIAFSVDNIAAITDQAWQPAWRALSPWWAYRAIEWNYPTQKYPAASTWGRALAGSVYDRLAERKDLEGLGALAEHAHCKGERSCVVGAALAQLRTELPFARFDDFYDCRALDEVKNAGGANNHEKALALWKLLTDVGIDAQLAITTHSLNINAAETFPSPVWFDHSLVYLPPTSKLPALWVDPSCEHCAVGEVPSWIVGKRALALSTHDGERGVEIRASPFLDVTGTVSRPARRERTSTMTVGVDGDVSIVEDEVREGVAAVDVLVEQADMTDDAIKKAALEALRYRSRSVSLRKAPRWTCDRATARCTRRLEYAVPGLGTVVADGSRILVAPFALNSLIENRVLDVEPAERRYDIHFDRDESFEETVVVVPPDGYVVEGQEVTTPLRTTGGLRVEVQAAVVDNRLRLVRRHAITRGVHGRAHWSTLQQTLTSSRTLKEQSITLQKKGTTTTTTAPATTATATATTTTP